MLSPICRGIPHKTQRKAYAKPNGYTKPPCIPKIEVLNSPLRKKEVTAMFPLDQLDTPSLLVDLDVMEENLGKMQNFATQNRVNLRPHTKAHKVPEIALQQIRRGAKGICVAKLGEAEVMLKGGVSDILITTPIANLQKIQRLITIRKQYPDARVIQVIDDKKHAELINDAAMEAHVSVDLLIEVESGQQRCGVEPGTELLPLIKVINALPNVRYIGIQAYSGHLQHVKSFQERKLLARAAVEPVFSFIQNHLTNPELRPEIVSGGGSGTYNMYEGLPFTELQAGSYLFMDWAYHTVEAANGDPIYSDFGCALKVWTTVISHPKRNRAIVDAGMKCLSVDSGMPVVEGYSDIVYTTGGDEHGILSLNGNKPLSIGDKLAIIPSHCDTTLGQFSMLYGVRNGLVETQWCIQGRGRSD